MTGSVKRQGDTWTFVIDVPSSTGRRQMKRRGYRTHDQAVEAMRYVEAQLASIVPRSLERPFHLSLEDLRRDAGLRKTQVDRLAGLSPSYYSRVVRSGGEQAFSVSTLLRILDVFEAHKEASMLRSLLGIQQLEVAS